MNWTKSQILQKLRRLHRAGKQVSYNAMCRRMQSLVSAAAYHFSSYRKAVQKAGIDYAEVTRRPHWTKQRVIQAIKRAKRNGEDLYWGAVSSRRDDLGRAAFAALQKRLFGRWDRALQAAGLDADEIARYRRWDRNSIIYELRSRAQDGEALNSGSIQQSDPGLHAAAVRRFGSYDGALRAAGLDPARHRRRKSWSKPEVMRQLKVLQRGGEKLGATMVRRGHSALYGAAVRLMGSWPAARSAAGIKWARKT
jgi:hypothetical protein